MPTPAEISAKVAFQTPSKSSCDLVRVSCSFISKSFYALTFYASSVRNLLFVKAAHFKTPFGNPNNADLLESYFRTACHTYPISRYR